MRKWSPVATATPTRLLNRALSCLTMAVAAALVVAACAPSPLQEQQIANESSTDELYAAMDAAVIRYSDGLQELRAGDRETGTTLMDDAAADLAIRGNACIETAGCEPQRFMAAYRNLLALRSAVLTGADEGFAEIKPPLEDEAPVLEELPEVTRSINLLHGHELADIIKINGPIKAALQDWLTWMRPNLIDAYENYEYMRHLMWPAYEQAKLPEALLFGILAQESGGRVHATSHSGAAGPFQFMYHTGLRFGLGNEKGFDTRYDPGASARANVAYLSEQFHYLNNNLEFALAAYNGGEGRMRQVAKRSHGHSFWSAEVMSQLPRETQEYVPYVLAAAWLFLHPDDYGLEFPKVDGAPGSVQLVNAMTLGELTVCLGQAAGSRDGWFRTLRNLNPRVEPDKPLAKGSTVALPAALVDVYQGQCIDSRMAQVAAELQRARLPGSVAHGGGRKYVVQRGDTLGSIAREQGCASSQALARANNIAAPRYLIRPAQQLTLAGCRG